MRELNNRTRELLERAKLSDGPPPRTQARIGRIVAGSVAASTVTLGVTAAEATLNATASSSGLLSLLGTVKFGLLASTSVGLVSGGLIIAVVQHERTVTTVVPQRRSVSHVPAATPTVVAALPVASALRLAPETPPSIAPAPIAPPQRTPLVRTQIADETRLLAEVQHALRAGDGNRALVLLGRYRRDFGKGALAPEATAAEVFARCAIGDVDGATRARARFVQQFPGSPLQPRVEASCFTVEENH